MNGWQTIVTSLGSGSVSGGAVYYQMRKLLPAQKRELEATAQNLAVSTVESALKVASARIKTLEEQVHRMTEKIGELRGRLNSQAEDRSRVREELTMALIERAKLQQQIIELGIRLGHQDIDLVVAPPDAIVMVGIDSGVIEYATEGVFGLLGYVPSELAGHPLDLLVPEEFRQHHKESRAEFSRHPRIRQMGSGIGLYARTATGATIPVDISLHPTGDGRVLALMKRREEPAPTGGQPAD